MAVYSYRENDGLSGDSSRAGGGFARIIELDASEPEAASVEPFMRAFLLRRVYCASEPGHFSETGHQFSPVAGQGRVEM